MEQTGAGKSFKATLNLPTTAFPIRANHPIDDAKILEEWQKADLYRKSFDLHHGSPQFLLSDGPPYANGPIHLGHAYNKILKDIVAKSRRMMGFHVPCTPGWDCHGLPIELKVAQENKGLDRIGLQTACRAYAEKWIGVQADGFKKLGVLMNWHQPYKTMDFQYEAKVIRSFADLVDRGYIERKNKTVPWCYSCQTVLATAEIEYAERKDPSIYVLFRADAAVFARFCSTLPSDAELFLIVWTTTPWTLTLNRAVLMSPTASYVIIQLAEQRFGVIGADLVDTLVDLLGIEKRVVATFAAADFSVDNLLVDSPVVPGLRVPVIKDLSVLVAEGTAFVQNAPGAGPEDYEVGVKNGLEIFCPVGPDGSMLDGINPVFLKGQSIEQVQGWVLSSLHENGLLLFKGSIKHSYPHCWRCRKGLIFRATKQWFCSLTHNALKEKALASIGHMLMLPEGSNNRLYATIDARYEWCLSRQRAWGTPIVALLCKQCDYVYCSKAFVDAVAALVEKHGIEVWTQLSAESLVQQGFCCPVCQSHLFEKEQDILDVWFDAGLTHVASISVPGKTHATFDLYLEGKDQHRGYFQSALLTGVALHGESPMRAIITHGFTVDALGKKMSKSLGNGVSPEELVAKIGIDCVRLWAATIDLSGEAVVSEVLLNNISEVYRKIRNTCRFCFQICMIFLLKLMLFCLMSFA
ncbi:isoleucine--tRNA ligase [bacterium]|nr:MAG: isoleucine--tRNA ligase [bacterium]